MPKQASLGSRADLRNGFLDVDETVMLFVTRSTCLSSLSAVLCAMMPLCTKKELLSTVAVSAPM